MQHAIAAAALTVLATGCGSDTASTRTADEAPSPPAKFADVTPGGERGTVEFYDDGKGIGLIVTDEGKEITVYRRQIAEAGSVLSEGQRVRFEVVLGNRAPELMNVTVIEGASIVPFVGSDGLEAPSAPSSGSTTPRASASSRPRTARTSSCTSSRSTSPAVSPRANASGSTWCRGTRARKRPG